MSPHFEVIRPKQTPRSSKLDWLNETLPEEMPEGWNLIEARGDGIAVTQEELVLTLDLRRMEKWRGLRCIITGGNELDGRRWVHMEIARESSRPSYADLLLAKNTWMGPQAVCIQIYAPQAETLKYHSNREFLYRCLDGQPFPSFTTAMQQYTF